MWLIPAHAGKTRLEPSRERTLRAHPRSRGENLNPYDPETWKTGSSPLTRGKQQQQCHEHPGNGLIPAHAGKTMSLSASPTTPRAHPRSRGENRASSSASSRMVGSSPLTRGKRTRGIAPGSSPGLIPAHAGKTRARTALPGRWAAHPRSRGENATREYASACQLGSSPLTRGKRVGGEAGRVRHGLIPAHAGKTWITFDGAERSEAHPRSRGENQSTVEIVVDDPGSSPLTRGKL